LEFFRKFYDAANQITPSGTKIKNKIKDFIERLKRGGNSQEELDAQKQLRKEIMKWISDQKNQNPKSTTGRRYK